LRNVRELLGHPKAVAVERDGARLVPRLRAARRSAPTFRSQLELASELGKPVVIHTRARRVDTLATLVGFVGHRRSPLLRIGAHAPTALAAAGTSRSRNATFPKAVDLRLAAPEVRPNGSWPRPTRPTSRRSLSRGKRNEPANVVHTLAALAQAARRSRPSSSADRARTPPMLLAAVSTRRRRSTASTSCATRTSSGDRAARRARAGRRRARDRPGQGVLTRYLAERVAASTRSRSTARSSRRSTGLADNVDVVFGDALQVELPQDADEARRQPPVQRRDAARRREPRRAAEPRALVRHGAAGGRRPLLRRAGHEGLRRGLGVRPARRRAHGLPSGLPNRVSAAAERRLRARRVSAESAA
jgi:hypothetical protein